MKKERNFVSDVLTFIFDMERVILQPANSLLQQAKKVRILKEVRSFYKALDAMVDERDAKFLVVCHRNTAEDHST